MTYDDIRILSKKIKSNISKVIVGKDDLIDLVLVSLFCSGHVLLEDVPGTGKTMLAKSIAKSIDCVFKRIQFTPDLLPSDITGINYYNQKTCEFVFRPGPIFANIILADEINRATPRTQSSLLECMEEKQITVDGDTRTLNSPFFVIATQNPIEIQGTFPLPEAQLDRFFMLLKPGYPSIKESRQILDRFQDSNPFTVIKTVATIHEIIDAQNSFNSVRINGAVKDYIVSIIELTRNHDKIHLGVSPRGSLALLRASQVLAILKGRDFVTPDDVKYLAVPVLTHRVVFKGRSVLSDNSNTISVISEILNQIPVPIEEF